MNLEQDEVRRQDVLNSFQAKIQSDIDVLRNLTYRALEQQSQSRLCRLSYCYCCCLYISDGVG